YHLAAMSAVYIFSSLFAQTYFSSGTGGLRRFAFLWNASYAAMALVMLSNNVVLMWIGIEATTLITAFMIYTNRTAFALEAMWKYLIICSVGVAFAFIGTILFIAAGSGAQGGTSGMLFWTWLRENSTGFKPVLVKAAFIFLLIGYGTKAGIAPMHTWLPDAHSQAPAPVSALFSGFLLNAALYCILRFLPITEKALGGSGWASGILAGFGVFSVVLAAGFIVFQRDLKRMLAYSSIEHIGIMCVGFGLGGAGAFAALFHMAGHMLAKPLAFFSAGRIGQIYGTYDMDKITGTGKVTRIWSFGLFGSLLALSGVAPFAMFMSELGIVRKAVAAGRWALLILMLLGAVVAFIGIIKRCLSFVFEGPPHEAVPVRATLLEAVIVIVPLAVLLGLGLVMPEFLRGFIENAARITGGGLP
ncbi:MAG: hydrogenase 4 subunit F, partial [Spirochaetales bacterium]